MPKADSSLNMLIVAAVLALGVGYYVPRTFSSRPVETTGATAVVADPKPLPKKVWAASAPGAAWARIPLRASRRLSKPAPTLSSSIPRMAMRRACSTA